MVGDDLGGLVGSEVTANGLDEVTLRIYTYILALFRNDYDVLAGLPIK